MDAGGRSGHQHFESDDSGDRGQIGGHRFDDDPFQLTGLKRSASSSEPGSASAMMTISALPKRKFIDASPCSMIT
ncbi:hypothetical protein [Paraburkholderia caribensis]|jgi:hypothetical protein|uniref:hypothetical protein n=1 Tax=Paraburkholderia caribensis TaxID=75105 RepID=UPI001CC496EB|nr:hypothetical protein [Paraburkholderia caribensis]